MISPRATFLFIFVVLSGYILGFPASGIASPQDNQTTYYELDNGMQVILKENHSSPMIASVIFVKSGSKYESRFENGITHFLEHLLFDGTTNLTQQELDESVRDLGGYINAFTRKELTAYLVLLPRQYIDYGMTVQADMLFNSVIPESQLPKERKVVISEIDRDLDSPNHAAEAFFTSHAYRKTPYERPVLGYRTFIENIPREAIVDYYKRYYRPANMTMLVIGDFQSPNMRETIASIFTSIPNPERAVDTAATGEGAIGTATGNQLSGPQRFDTVANVSSTYIDFSIVGPRYDDSLYPSFDLLTRYVNMKEVSPLYQSLMGGEKPLADELSVYLSTYEEFSRLEISVITERSGVSDSIVRIVLDELSAMADHEAPQETIEGIKVSNRTEAIYNAERLHYYGFMIAPMMALGYEFVEQYPGLFDAATWSQAQAAASRWLKEPDYVVSVVEPAEESTDAVYKQVSPPEAEIMAYFDTTQFPEYDLSKGIDLEYPETETIEFEWSDDADYSRRQLDNGLICLVKSSPDSRVFAMNVLGRDRTANEPDGKAGITDFVNRCIEKGTTTRSAQELTTDLAGIGANVTLYDNPWIPYDDRYTTRRFSFLKFETIDDYAAEGFALFSEMLLSPAFNASDVEQVRQSMMGILGRSGSSPRSVGRNLFYETLFEGTPLARPISGSARSIGSITVDDLKSHHQRFYAPSNIILSITTNLPADTVLAWVDDRFAELLAHPDNYERTVRPRQPRSAVTQHSELDSRQLSMYLGGLTFGANDSDAVALRVAGSVLSHRLYSSLRERKGLAYSVGAGVKFHREYGWYYGSIGTATENYQDAVDGIILEIDKLRLDGPRPSEVDRARNQIWGRLMSAKLSRINQAYYLALDEYLGRPAPYDPEFLESLATIDNRSVRRAAARAFNTLAYVLAVAGPKP